MEKIIKKQILEYCTTTENIHEAIYIIGGIYIDGEFDYGLRGLDHNALIHDGYGWVELLSYGTVIIPETLSYISDTPCNDLDELSYSRLPLNNNHIVGFK